MTLHELARCIDSVSTRHNQFEYKRVVQHLRSRRPENGLTDIRELLNFGTLEEKYNRAFYIAWVWFVSLGGPPEERELEVTPQQKAIQSYMYSWNLFANLRIPFEKWSDLAEEGLTLLAEKIDHNDLNFNGDPAVQAFKRRFQERRDEFENSEEYGHLFYDLMGR